MKENQIETKSISSARFSVSIKRRKSPFTGGTCTALADGSGDQAAALAAFATLNTDSIAAIAVVNQNPLGPYGANGSCDYGCSYTDDWKWWDDYRPCNTNLNNGVSLLNAGGSYNSAYQLTQNWVGTDLPIYTTNLQGDINTIIQVDNAIIASGQETPAQAAQLASAFSNATSVLQNNITEVSQALQNITAFLTQQNANVGYLQSLATSLHNWMVTDATGNENSLLSKISCGSGDVENSFNAMFADMTAKFGNMAPSFNTVNTDFQNALTAVQLVAGVFLVLQSDNTLVGNFVTAAQSYDPTNPLRKMKLDMATGEWGNLVSIANANLA